MKTAAEFGYPEVEKQAKTPLKGVPPLFLRWQTVKSNVW